MEKLRVEAFILTNLYSLVFCVPNYFYMHFWFCDYFQLCPLHCFFHLLVSIMNIF